MGDAEKLNFSFARAIPISSTGSALFRRPAVSDSRMGNPSDRCMTLGVSNNNLKKEINDLRKSIETWMISRVVPG